PGGGLGGGGRLNGGGGGGGGGSVSPLSPNASGGDGFRRGLDDDRGGGGHASEGLSLSPTRSAGDRPDGLRLRGDHQDLPAAEDAGRLEKTGREGLKDVRRRIRGGKGDDDVSQLTDTAESALSDVSILTQARQQQAHALLQAHRDVIEPDNFGRPVVRGEILAVAPTPEALARAQRAGFRVRASESLPELGVRSVVLLGPRGTSAVEALRRMRAMDPQGQYDFNHLYQAGGEVVGRLAKAPVTGPAGAPNTPIRGIKVGLVDGAVATGQPSLSGARLVQRAFAPGGSRATPHATAVASLIAGRKGSFRGAAPGATLFVADVYGTTPTGGSADAIARALGWLAQAGAPVINISLVGPPNLLLEAAVKALIARGHLVVAAVGNDGPAAPPLYPAAYPGVVAVTGVDARRHLLPEASHGPHVDFAAPGSDMAAAGVDGGFVSVRGTSFAAPIAAGLLARFLETPDRAGAQRAISTLGRQALDLGRRGPDPIFGRGLVGVELRTPPADVRARYALREP
ncbi:MAG: hypothetical protein JWP50_813, partial [Phenylobacterium sp.]|nr:hypothetical protein [Phenylobacterium sp.]